MFGLLLTGVIVTVGTFWAFERGAPDFSVFYSAWQTVMTGKGIAVYHSTPDRFLYAPGFAWLLGPLGLLPRDLALALWCFSKAAVIGLIVRGFQVERALGARAPQGKGMASIGVASLGVVLLARPLLIDFQYGQVNVFMLGACVWALLRHFKSDREGYLDFLAWFVFAVAAVAKLIPAPLFAVPWLITAGRSSKKLWLERAGSIAGAVVMLALPIVSVGWQGNLTLLEHWHQALVSRGFPLESHNQSFAAFLHHYFSGEPIHIIAQGMVPIVLGSAWLSPGTLGYLSLAWTAITAGLLMAWLFSGDRRPSLHWIAVMVAMLILPSHLVWKPYFVMMLPLGVWCVSNAKTRVEWGALAALFVTINLTGFDFVGHAWGARFEAASVLLWSGLGLFALARRIRLAGDNH